MKSKKLNFFDRSLEYTGHSGTSPPNSKRKFLTINDFVMLEPLLKNLAFLKFNLRESSEKLFDNNKKWLDSKETAHYLGITVANLRVKVSRGEILVNGRLGRNWRFRRDELDLLLESSLQGDSK